MKPIKTKKPKRLYYILLNEKIVGKSWAVSPDKARANYWWKEVKEENEFSPRDYDPEDFDVVEAWERSYSK